MSRQQPLSEEQAVRSKATKTSMSECGPLRGMSKRKESVSLFKNILILDQDVMQCFRIIDVELLGPKQPLEQNDLAKLLGDLFVKFLASNVE